VTSAGHQAGSSRVSISALVGISHESEAKREEEGLGKEAEGRRRGEDTA